MTRFPKPTYRNPLPPKPDVADYEHAADYIVAVWESTDARPISNNTSAQVSRWAIRRAFPNMLRIMARMAVDALLEWQTHNRQDPTT